MYNFFFRQNQITRIKVSNFKFERYHDKHYSHWHALRLSGFFSQFKIYNIPFCFSKKAIKENILHGCGNDITGTCLLTRDYFKFW